jgi:hypothetical protein
MKRVLGLVIGLSIIIGTGSLVAQDYFPLMPGHKWHYEWSKSEIILEVEAAPHVYNRNTYWAVIDSTPEVAYDSSTIGCNRTNRLLVSVADLFGLISIIPD